jgi:hypothetical protein
MKFWLYWLKDSRLLHSVQFLYLIKGFIPPLSGLIAFQCSLCNTEFRIFILPRDRDDELVVLTSPAPELLAFSGCAPRLTHCVGSVGILIITFAWVTWNYGSLCEFRPNCVGHQQGSIHKHVHFALWRNKPGRS